MLKERTLRGLELQPAPTRESGLRSVESAPMTVNGKLPDRDHYWMRRALALAKRGLGTTQPNPLVGAIVLNPNGDCVGRGYHRKAGEPHAEVVALDQAGSKARDGILYVTLEPCVHHGRTPPCADRVISAGIRRVVTCSIDPNPVVNGR